MRSGRDENLVIRDHDQRAALPLLAWRLAKVLVQQATASVVDPVVREMWLWMGSDGGVVGDLGAVGVSAYHDEDDRHHEQQHLGSPRFVSPIPIRLQDTKWEGLAEGRNRVPLSQWKVEHLGLIC